MPALKKQVVQAISEAFEGRRDPNQSEAFKPTETGEAIAAGQLKSIVERIERLDEDRRAVVDDIKEVYGEAKGNGFNCKAIRKIVALRRKTAAERAEEDAILELYLNALKMPV